MKIADLVNQSGIIIETLTSAGIPTGNVYKIGCDQPCADGRLIAWKQYRQGKVKLHPSVRCRVLDARPFHGTYGPF